MNDRTPDQIRDSAVRCFNQLAPAKYDVGQAKSEITNNLDKHPDLIGAIREELLDSWFYVESLAKLIDKLEEENDWLHKENERLNNELLALRRE
tara:strand:+ start:13673 stop:13954 length:282 start_codon:yes stop_codon:yes gene_type:complete